MINPTSIISFFQNGGLKPISKELPDDLFIASASYEPRATTVCDSLLGSYKAVRGVVYVNNEFKTEAATARHLEKMITMVSGCTTECMMTEGSWEDEIMQFTVLKANLAPNGIQPAIKRITADITTFNREALFASLTILRWAYPNAHIRLVYVSPEEYNPHGREVLMKECFLDKNTSHEAYKRINKYLWLSRGFRKMRNAVGFAGVQRAHLPSMLILLPGYEVERALTLADNLEPSLVLLGKATDSTRDEFFQRSLEAMNQMVRLFEGRQPIEEFDFSCKRIGFTVEVLKKLVEKHTETHNVFITSMSTKPSAIATFLVAEQFPDIQLTCNIPGEYNIEDYSKGAHEVSFFDLAPKMP